MARVQQDGMLGNVKGKVGNVVRTKWKGKEVMRKNGVRNPKKQSELQKISQSKFGVGSSFIYDMRLLLEITYKHLAVGKTARNAAMSNLMQTAITGSYPDFAIDYPKVNFSIEKDLHNAPVATAASTLPGLVSFSWTFDGRTDHSSSRDKAMLVAYCDSGKWGDYNTAAAQRDDMLGHLKLPDFRGMSVHTWIIFISEDQGKISGTKYTGLVDVV